MTIEFRCPSCQKLLRTQEDKAGLTTNCPKCSEPVTVPLESESSEGEEFDFGGLSSGDAEADYAAEGGFADSVAAQTPQPKRKKEKQPDTCPMCGSAVSANDARCSSCGEDLRVVGTGRRVASGPIDVGEILTVSIEVLKANLGLCVGVAVIYLVISFAANFASELVSGIIQIAAQNANGGAVIAVVIMTVIALTVIKMMINIYFSLGVASIALSLVRGKSAEISDLFTGINKLPQALLNGLVFFILIYLPMLPGGAVMVAGAAIGGNDEDTFLAIGGIMILLGGIATFYISLRMMFFQLIIVDETNNDSGLQPLSNSWRITSGHGLRIFLLILLSMVIQMAGMMACCVGLLFSTPLITIMFTEAYEHARLTAQTDSSAE
ncbi:hypothetical protein [Calycomorphotria hydatis]|uniref:Double zinc ribbon n=1 Tax=Calycomorphotria hydatis TaxID=2528027 RepID=A0A517TCS4_9PLAN|nr:hypothetical protein [Calycomorphotria hydatis]QDT66179.1 hypothetical protein V22_34440 [Calycomorphotria hydatis]